MRAGSLDHVITIQRFTNTVDDYGTPVETWADLVTLRAQIIQAGTEEYIRSSGAADVSVVVFRTHHFDGVTTADRVLYQGSIHNIKETKPLGRQQGLELRTQMLGAMAS